ncbi:MAG: cytochrome C oxidase subunit IV family protein [Gemmatimonadota bacterium]
MAHSEAGEPHVSNRLYIVIAVILAVLTAMELMVFYVEALRPLLLPILMVLMAAKFTLVVMFFMHLKFDSKVLTGIFAWGVFIAATIIVSLLAIFGKLA